MKHKSLILFWIDVALLVSFLTLATTGSIMRWVLPPGSGGRAGGHAARKELLDLSRHDWGDVHFWVAIIMVTLVLVHLLLHWGWIRTWMMRIARSIRAPEHTHMQVPLIPSEARNLQIPANSALEMPHFVRHDSARSEYDREKRS